MDTTYDRRSDLLPLNPRARTPTRKAPSGGRSSTTSWPWAITTACPAGSEDEALAFAVTLLDAGARTDVRDDLLQSTPLGWACRWGRTPIVRELLDRGVDPVEPDAQPWATPLAWARRMGHHEIAAALLLKSP